MEKENFYLQNDSWGGLEKGTSRKIMEEHEKESPEPLSGIETAKLASKVYEFLGPEIGCYLTEANVVLAMSGMKGHTDMPWVKLDKAKIEILEQAGEQLERLGLRIGYNKKLKEKLESGSEIAHLSLTNLRGIEIKSKNTHIPGVPLFDSRSGMEGLYEWYREYDNSMKEAQEAGKIAKEVDLEVIFEGVDLGYPDQAILDFEKCLREGEIHKDLIRADIVSSLPKEYQGAIPEFYYYPEHKNNPEISEYIEKARKILEEFYNSDWFRDIQKDHSYNIARIEKEETYKEGIKKRNQESE